MCLVGRGSRGEPLSSPVAPVIFPGIITKFPELRSQTKSFLVRNLYVDSCSLANEVRVLHGVRGSLRDSAVLNLTLRGNFCKKLFNPGSVVSPVIFRVHGFLGLTASSVCPRTILSSKAQIKSPFFCKALLDHTTSWDL